MPRFVVICVALMFAFAAVCLVLFTDYIQNDYVKRLYMCKVISIQPPLYILAEYDDYVVCLNGRDTEGIHPFVSIARMGCQEDDGN